MQNFDEFELPPTTQTAAQQAERLAEMLATLPEGFEVSANPLFLALVLGRDPSGSGHYDRAVGPELYAQIAMKVVNLVSAQPERRGTWLLESVDGARRAPGPWNIGAVTGRLRMAMDSIASLPTGPRRLRLLGLGTYHRGLVCRASGHYEGAADAQTASALLELTAGNINMAATAVFVSQVERTSQSFKENTDHRTAVLALQMAFDAGEGALPSSWHDIEGPGHLLSFDFACNEQGPRYDELLGRRHAAQPNDFWDFVYGRIFKAYWNEQWEAIPDLAKEFDQKYGAVGSSSIADAACLTLLAAARALRQMCQFDDAKTMLGRVIDYNRNHGGHWIKARARRELDVLMSP